MCPQHSFASPFFASPPPSRGSLSPLFCSSIPADDVSTLASPGLRVVGRKRSLHLALEGEIQRERRKQKKNSFELTDDAGLPQREFVEVVARGVLVLVLDRRRGAAHDLGASRRDQVERVIEREGAGGLHRPAGRAGERWGSSCCCHRFVLESSARKVLCKELISTSGSRKEKRKHFSSSHPSARALARSHARKDRNQEVNFLIQIDLANLQTDRKKREEKEEREGRKERESPPQTSRSAPRLSLTFAAVVALVVAVDASRALLGHRSKLCRGPRL